MANRVCTAIVIRMNGSTSSYGLRTDYLVG